MPDSSICAIGSKRFLQNQNRRALDGDAGQSSGAPRCGVDVDAVLSDVGMRHRRVAMNDKFSVVLRRVEKLMTNPEQIVEVLPLDRNARANPGMDEQEVSAAETVVET